MTDMDIQEATGDVPEMLYERVAQHISAASRQRFNVRRFCSALCEVASENSVTNELLFHLADNSCFDDTFFHRLTADHATKNVTTTSDSDSNIYGMNGLMVNVQDEKQLKMAVCYIVENLKKGRVLTLGDWQSIKFESEENRLFMSYYVHSKKTANTPRHAMALVYALLTVENLTTSLSNTMRDDVVGVCNDADFGVYVFHGFKQTYTTYRRGWNELEAEIKQDALDYGMSRVAYAMQAISRTTNEDLVLHADYVLDGCAVPMKTLFGDFIERSVLPRVADSYFQNDFYDKTFDPMAPFIVDWFDIARRSMMHNASARLLKAQVNNNYIGGLISCIKNDQIWKKHIMMYKQTLSSNFGQFSHAATSRETLDEDVKVLGMLIFDVTASDLHAESPNVIEKYEVKRRNMMNLVDTLVRNEVNNDVSLRYETRVARFYKEETV
jgi:regulation of enolase protein 1 (concanavalin A-like superfamily)